MWCSGYRLEAYKTTLSSNLLGNRLGCSPQGGKFLHSRPWFIESRKEEPK